MSRLAEKRAEDAAQALLTEKVYERLEAAALPALENLISLSKSEDDKIMLAACKFIVSSWLNRKSLGADRDEARPEGERLSDEEAARIAADPALAAEFMRKQEQHEQRRSH